MNLILTILCCLLFITTVTAEDLDIGTIKLNTLINRTLYSSNRILNFTKKDFKQFALQYPRPYDLVLYFYAKQVPLSNQLYEEFNYTVQLYYKQGQIITQYNPTFFARIDFSQANQQIFKLFQFDSAPNLVVSKPHMAVISKVERQSYLKDYKWRISHTDGVVNTRKMLEFINKRTSKEVVYKPTEETIKYVLSVFTAVCVCGVVVYKLLKFIWNHWFFWFLTSMVCYMTCMSGIVYCIINGTLEQDLKKSINRFFEGGGRRDQGFYEGCLVSAIISLTGIVLIIVVVSGQKLKQRYSAVIGIVGVIVVYYLMSYIESVYRTKSWYGPSYSPPEHYLKGPLSVDQGNNI